MAEPRGFGHRAEGTMTTREYAEYQAAVAAFMESEGLANLSRTAECDEDFFSWRSCDCCGTNLGGSRIDANGYNPTTREVQEYVICTDCEYYAEYGQLDDQTMADLTEDTEPCAQ
jgi:hypothetical protein